MDRSILFGLLSFVLYLAAHFGIAYLLFRWGRKHFGTK